MRPTFKEAGSSFITAPFAPSGRTYNAGIAGQNFGTQSSSGFLTGVGCLARNTEYVICDVTRPVSQATVTAVRQTDGIQRQAVTGSSGQFDLQLDHGTWDVEIVAAGYLRLTFSNIVMAGVNVQLDFTPQAGGPPPGPRTWRNPNQPLDVSGDGVIAPYDASLLIDSLNKDGSRTLPPIAASSQSPPPYYDPTGDNIIAPNDVLMVINYLNQPGGSSEGESDVKGSGLVSKSHHETAAALLKGPLDLRLTRNLETAPENTSPSERNAQTTSTSLRPSRLQRAGGTPEPQDVGERFLSQTTRQRAATFSGTVRDVAGDVPGLLSKYALAPTDSAHAMTDEIFGNWTDEELLLCTFEGRKSER
jgi:hypothetical protein